MSVAFCPSPSCQSPSLVSRPRRRRLRGRFRVSRLRVFFSSTLALHRTVTSISSAGGPPSSLICCSCSGDVNVRPYQGGCRPTLQSPVSSTGRLRGLFRVIAFRVILCRPRPLLTRWSPSPRSEARSSSPLFGRRHLCLYRSGWGAAWRPPSLPHSIGRNRITILIYMCLMLITP